MAAGAAERVTVCSSRDGSLQSRSRYLLWSTSSRATEPHRRETGALVRRAAAAAAWKRAGGDRRRPGTAAGRAPERRAAIGRADRHDDQGRRRGHRQHREREPDHARGRQRPAVGTNHRPAIRHESGDVVGRSVPQGGDRGREGPADCDGAERAVLVSAVVGSPAAGRSGVRAGNSRCRPGFGHSTGAFGYSRRDDDGAARLRRLGAIRRSFSTST